MPYSDPEKKKQYDRDYGNNQKEKRASRSKKWREDNSEKMKLHARKHHLKKKFGLSLDDYEQLVSDQGGKCAICGTKDPTPWDVFVIDHCHKTGRIRGLLCQACNNILGQSKDDIQILRNTILYLEKS